MGEQAFQPLRILIDPFPAYGHYSAALSMADRLKSRGHTVQFIGLYEMKNRVLDRGFQFQIANTVLLRGLDTYRDLFSSFQIAVQCLKWWRSGERKKSFLKSVAIHDLVVERLNPDLILVDEHYSYKVQLYLRKEIPVASFQTMINPYKGPNCPPINTLHVPENTKASLKAVEKLWSRYRRKQLKQRIKNRMYFGQDALPFTRSLMKKEGVHWAPRRDRSYGIGVAGVPNYSLVPERFGLGGESKRDQYYFPLSKDPATENNGHPVFRQLLSRLTQRPDLKVVYCSMGTLSEMKKEQVSQLFMSLVAVASACPDLLFVASTGNHVDPKKLEPIPDNFLSAPFLPQKAILKHAHLMITHGGLNSVKEAIWEKVPLIVYPMALEGDNPGIAVRVVYHGLGVMGELEGVSPEKLKQHITKLQDGYEEYQSAIMAMNDQFNQSSKVDIPSVHGLAI